MSGKNGNAKRKRTRYDDKFRASAVVMLEAAGYPGKDGALTQTANHLKVPINTLKGWFTAERNPPPAELRNEKKRELAIELKSIAYKLAGAMVSKIEEATLQQTAVSLGIVIDKMQLLTGQPTDIVDDASITDDERAKRIAAILDRARTRRAGQPDIQD